jgi:Ran GTPase-activating protein (RanGAP) involved in mRNA processing and transport
MQKVFKTNVNIELLNLADCKLDGEQVKYLCESLMINQKLKYFYLRNSNLGVLGSEFISKLVLNNKSLIEMDMFNCGINESGGNLIGAALKHNFCIEKLSIGENQINRKDIDTIQQSVVFNSNYNQIK